MRSKKEIAEAMIGDEMKWPMWLFMLLQEKTPSERRELYELRDRIRFERMWGDE